MLMQHQLMPHPYIKDSVQEHWASETVVDVFTRNCHALTHTSLFWINQSPVVNLDAYFLDTKKYVVTIGGCQCKEAVGTDAGRDAQKNNRAYSSVGSERRARSSSSVQPKNCSTFLCSSSQPSYTIRPTTSPLHDLQGAYERTP